MGGARPRAWRNGGGVKPHRFLAAIADIEPAPPFGHVAQLGAGLVRATGPLGRLGELYDIALGDDGAALAELVAIDDQGVTLIPLDHERAVAIGARVTPSARHRRLRAGAGFAGRAVDALGRPVDGGGAIEDVATVDRNAIGLLDRVSPDAMLETGIRAIDGLLTLGIGQRIGVFAASGVGKTSLIEQLARQVAADRCILCLVGERGREVSALWDVARASDAPERFTLVAATSDESPVMRARAVEQALALAEYWRDRGEHVVLMIDSVTRLAMALREIGLAAGAPPTVRAYTPNVFAALPRVVERCGAVRGGGAITAILTVLSETDEVDDPIVEVMKSLLDGHIVLSRGLADQGHFPAIDVVRSVSRQAGRLIADDHAARVRAANGLLASYDENRIMIESGVYRARSNARIDQAIAAREPLAGFLRQRSDEAVGFNAMLTALAAALPA